MRRRKRLRYDGRIMARFRRERRFQKCMDDFAEVFRRRIENYTVSPWLSLLPANAPSSGKSDILTKFLLDEVADSLGVVHP